MTSFISTFSIFVLVLSTLCFALPVVDEKTMPTSEMFGVDFTTETMKDKPMISMMEREEMDKGTTVVSFISTEQSPNKRVQDQKMTPQDIQESNEKFTRPPRIMNDMTTSDDMLMTTEKFSMEHVHNEREEDDEMDSKLETSTQFNDKQERDADVDDQTMEQTTVSGPISRRNFHEKHPSTTVKSSFISTSSDVAPHFYESETTMMSNKDSEKYGAHVEESAKEMKQEDDLKMKMRMKAETKSAHIKTKMTSKKDDSDEDSQESKVPTAEYKQTAVKQVIEMSKTQTEMEKNDQPVQKPTELLVSSKTTKNIHKQPLKQGQKPSVTEEEKSNY